MRRRRRKASVKSPSDSVDKLELKEEEGIKDGSGKKRKRKERIRKLQKEN